jgi:hypothetical protein
LFHPRDILAKLLLEEGLIIEAEFTQKLSAEGGLSGGVAEGKLEIISELNHQ